MRVALLASPDGIRLRAGTMLVLDDTAPLGGDAERINCIN